MMRTMRFLSVMAVLALLTASCGASSRGPQAWIDRPLEGGPYAQAPLTIQAHASDAEGVSGFTFYINGEPIQEVGAGGARLGEAALEWEPPGPGVYTLEVQAVDAAGNRGDPAEVQIFVGGGPAEMTTQPVPPPQAAESTETSGPETTPTGQVSPTEPVPGSAFTANQDSNCRAGPGGGFEVEAFLLQGQQVAIVGRDASGTWLLVALPEGGETCWVAAYLGEVSGDIEAVAVVPTPIPPVTSTWTPVPATPTAQDTTPPAITFADASPDEILTEGPGCPGYARKTVVTVTASDPSGIASAVASWSIGGESGQVALSPVGGGSYQGEVGPVNTTGTLTINITVMDNAGNPAYAGPLSVEVNNCIT